MASEVEPWKLRHHPWAGISGDEPPQTERDALDVVEKLEWGEWDSSHAQV